VKRKKKVAYRKVPPLNPNKVIDDAKDIEDWFAAFANAVSYFEHYGYWAIILYCYREKVQLTEKARNSLKRLSAANICLLLRILKLTDNEAYSSMRKIIEERSNLVHPSRKGIRYRDKKKRDNAVMLLNQAKECIEKIKSTIKSTKAKKGNKP